MKLAAFVLMSVGLYLVPVTGQPGMGARHMMMPLYDVQTEVTVTGTVEAITTMDCMAMSENHRAMQRGMMHDGPGRHVTLRTATGTLEVHLGPAAYLDRENILLREGDPLEIVGSKVMMGPHEVLLARQLRRGEQSWTLRDDDGTPRWRMR